MMVSTAMAVLPVWRSPMISSRWPRPMGIMPSMALRPVCSGSPARARPRLSRARSPPAPRHSVAHRHVRDAPRALDDVAFLYRGGVAKDRDTDVVLLEV